MYTVQKQNTEFQNTYKQKYAFKCIRMVPNGKEKWGMRTKGNGTYERGLDQ